MCLRTILTLNREKKQRKHDYVHLTRFANNHECLAIYLLYFVFVLINIILFLRVFVCYFSSCRWRGIVWRFCYAFFLGCHFCDKIDIKTLVFFFFVSDRKWYDIAHTILKKIFAIAIVGELNFKPISPSYPRLF